MEPENNTNNTAGSDCQKRLVSLLDSGCVYHAKRWSGDTHADMGGTIDESATDEIMRRAAEMIRSLLAEKITQKRDALRVMKRNAKRRMMNGKNDWCDMDAKAAIKAAEAEIRDLRYQANS